MITQVISQTASQWYARKLQQTYGGTQSKEKMIHERKFENELKHLQDELNEIANKLKLDFSKKLSKNLSRVVEKQKTDSSLASVD